MINPLRPIASGVLDTSGSDSLWLKMCEMGQIVECLRHHPPIEYASLNTNIHGTLRRMCQELIDNYRNSLDCGTINIINPVTIPTEESVDLRLQSHMAHTVLETL